MTIHDKKNRKSASFTLFTQKSGRKWRSFKDALYLAIANINQMLKERLVALRFDFKRFPLTNVRYSPRKQIFLRKILLT